MPDSISLMILSVEIFARLGPITVEFLECDAVCLGEWVWSAGSGNVQSGPGGSFGRK